MQLTELQEEDVAECFWMVSCSLRECTEHHLIFFYCLISIMF